MTPKLAHLCTGALSVCAGAASFGERLGIMGRCHILTCHRSRSMIAATP